MSEFVYSSDPEETLRERIRALSRAGHRVQVRTGALDDATLTRELRVEMDGRYIQGSVTEELVHHGQLSAVTLSWLQRLAERVEQGVTVTKEEQL